MSGLQRRLYRIDALAIALGSVIGVGVFRSTGLVLRGADGFVGATALWIGIGLICATGAILYADLSSRVPELAARMPTSASPSVGRPASSTAG